MSPLPLLGVVDLSFTGAKLVAFWELTKFSGIIFCIYFVINCISERYKIHKKNKNGVRHYSVMG